MRLIDADALTRRVHEELHITNSRKDIIDLIDEAPTIDPSKSTEQNVADVPSGDLISRQDVIDCINKTNSTLDEVPICKDIRSAFANAIKSLPSADRPSADVVHKPDYSYEADMVKRLKEATSADRPNYNLETIANIVKQLGHLDGCIADILDRPQVNPNSAEEQIAETCDRPKGEWIDNPQPYVPEASTERVVHCKDCVYSRQPEEELFVCENRFGMSGWVRENEFCSSGSL